MGVQFALGSGSPARTPAEGRVASTKTANTATAETAIDAELADFVRDHYARLVRLAGLICRESRDADDAVQNGLEQAWRRRSSLRDRGALRSWLGRTVVREAIRLQRPRRLPSIRLLEGPREISLVTDVGVDFARLPLGH